MPYLGRNLTLDKTTRTRKLDSLAASFNSAQTVFTLTSDGAVVYPATARNLLISINGVVQEPETAYTISGTTITFTAAPTTGATFFGVLNGEPNDLLLNPNITSLTVNETLNVTGISTFSSNVTVLGTLQVGNSTITINSSALLVGNAVSNVVINSTAVGIGGTIANTTALVVPATSKVYLDGGGDTYVTESSVDVMDLYAGGANTLRMNSSGAVVTGTLSASSTLAWGGGSAITSSNHVAILADNETVSGAWVFTSSTPIDFLRRIDVQTQGVINGSFYDGIYTRGWAALGDDNSHIVIGGYRSAQWSGVKLYGSGSVAGTFAPAASSVVGTFAWGGGSAISSSSNVALLAGAAFTGATSITTSVDAPSGLTIDNNSLGTTASAVLWLSNSGSTNAGFHLGGASRATYANIGANVLYAYTDNAAGIAFLVDTAGPITFATNASTRLSITSSGDVAIASGKKFFLDGVGGTGDTYIFEAAANVGNFYAGGIQVAGWYGSGFFVIAGKPLYYDGGGDTYTHEEAANTLTTVVGGTKTLEVTAGALKVLGAAGVGPTTPNISGYTRAITLSATTAGQSVVYEAQGNITADGGFAAFNVYNSTNFMGGVSYERSGANNTSRMRFATANAGTAIYGLGINSTQDVGIKSGGKFFLDGVEGTGNTYIYESSADNIAFVAGGTERGGVNVYGLYVNTYPTTASAANLWSQNGSNIHIATSSIRYKHDIHTIDYDTALATVMGLRPITYRGKTDEDQRRYAGFVAEEVALINPLLATYDEGGESGTPNYVTYDRVTAYLVAVVQKQQAEIDALKAQIKEQK